MKKISFSSVVLSITLFSAQFIVAQNHSFSISYVQVMGHKVLDYNQGNLQKHFGLEIGHEKHLRSWLSWSNQLRYFQAEQSGDHSTYSYETSTNSSSNKGTAVFYRRLNSKAAFAQTGLNFKWDFRDGVTSIALRPTVGAMLHFVNYSNELDYEFSFDSRIKSSDRYTLKPMLSPVWGIELPYYYHIDDALSVICKVAYVSSVGQVYEHVKSFAENDLSKYPSRIRERVKEQRTDINIQPLMAVSFDFGLRFLIR